MKKSFAINERTGFEFKVDAYNFINHPNWADPQLNPTSGTFGQVTSKTTTNPRTLQAGLDFKF